MYNIFYFTIFLVVLSGASIIPSPSIAEGIVITSIKQGKVQLTDAKGRCKIKVDSASLQSLVGKSTRKDPKTNRLHVPYKASKECNPSGKWWSTARFIKTDARAKWDCTTIATSRKTASGGSGYGGGCKK